MMDIAFEMKENNEKRETAMNNLLVLARERAGAEIMFNDGIVSKITKILKLEKNEEIITIAIRIITELCKDNINRTKDILKHIGIPWCLEMINSKISERVNAAQYYLQVSKFNKYKKLLFLIIKYMLIFKIMFYRHC